MTFDTKSKVILREDLEPWQELNVTAFVVSGIAGTQDVMGEVYRRESQRERHAGGCLYERTFFYPER